MMSGLAESAAPPHKYMNIKGTTCGTDEVSDRCHAEKTLLCSLTQYCSTKATSGDITPSVLFWTVHNINNKQSNLKHTYIYK